MWMASFIITRLRSKERGETMQESGNSPVCAMYFEAFSPHMYGVPESRFLALSFKKRLYFAATSQASPRDAQQHSCDETLSIVRALPLIKESPCLPLSRQFQRTNTKKPSFRSSCNWKIRQHLPDGINLAPPVKHQIHVSALPSLSPPPCLAKPSRPRAPSGTFARP